MIAAIRSCFSEFSLKRPLVGLALTLTAAGLSSPAASEDQSTLDKVKARGEVVCAVSGKTKGFSLPDAQGVLQGIDADYCRAVAAAVLGDAKKVKFVNPTGSTRFTVLQSGEVDLVNMSATWTAARDSQLGLNFANVYLYDGGGFLVRKDSGITKREELDGGTFCITPGSTSEQVLLEYARAQKIKIVPVNIDASDQLAAAFISGRCDVLMSDLSYLAAFRAAQGADAEKYELLPGPLLFDSPLGSVVRASDARWFNIVRWTHFAMVSAERFGITSKNIDEMLRSNNPDIRMLLGVDGKVGDGFGLTNDWVANVVRQVGNYGEVYDRDIAPLGMLRKENALAANGGLQYAPPYR